MILHDFEPFLLSLLDVVLGAVIGVLGKDFDVVNECFGADIYIEISQTFVESIILFFLILLIDL